MHFYTKQTTEKARGGTFPVLAPAELSTPIHLITGRPKVDVKH